MKAGIVVFPGSNCDDDMVHVFEDVLGIKAHKIWHKERTLGTMKKGDVLILPGGFSFGDYLRSGAIAKMSPVMDAVIDFANNGGMVIGICNGFQILCEAQLLPGVLLKNNNQKYISRTVSLRVETTNSAVTNGLTTGQVLNIPIAHADGRYFCDEKTLEDLHKTDAVLLRYCSENGEMTSESNPNGSIDHIAGICNSQRNVIGMMPHPERAAEASLGNDHGLELFKSLLNRSAALA